MTKRAERAKLDIIEEQLKEIEGVQESNPVSDPYDFTGRLPKTMDPNPQKGERGSFSRLSLTLPESMLNTLRSVSLERKITKKKNVEVNAIVREAIAEFIMKQSVK